MYFKKTMCRIQDSEIQVPCIRSDDVVFCPDTHLSSIIRPDDENFPYEPPSVSRSIRPDVSATRSDALQCSTSKRISFPNKDMGRQLQPSRRRGYSVRTLSLIRQVVQKTFNHPDVSLHCSDTQTLLWKLRAAEVQPSGR